MSNKLRVVTLVVCTFCAGVQFWSVFTMNRRQKEMDKTRDEIKAISLANAERIDQYQLKLQEMKDACGIPFGLKRN